MGIRTHAAHELAHDIRRSRKNPNKYREFRGVKVGPLRATERQTHIPRGVGFFMPETPVFIGDSVWMVAKWRETVYLVDVSKNPKMAHEVAHESG